MIKIDMNDKNEKNYGFTLMEILVVMGIMVVLSTLGLLVGLDFYKSYAFNSERDLVVSMLQKARNQSLANINQKPHGVKIEPGKYIVFEGLSYATRIQSADQEFLAHPGIQTDPPNMEVVFEQLSGDAIPSLNFQLKNDKRSEPIEVNSEGGINW